MKCQIPDEMDDGKPFGGFLLPDREHRSFIKSPTGTYPAIEKVVTTSEDRSPLGLLRLTP